jgi:hypothetical protein
MISADKVVCLLASVTFDTDVVCSTSAQGSLAPAAEELVHCQPTAEMHLRAETHLPVPASFLRRNRLF